ncbi:hypothetical protein COV11_04190 [Candidatus Woesearchaeota archaeon CG10_big_fil_rev_8_21_14_0_10_30_7]|nr:MAG: hypothetical protein COV11_04190 [Candidatus Woesearchaeota archaeon CG10_big_fil_rev_8_21_14_0_10_30_7]
MYKLSPSSLHVLKDCPRCFWLQHNKNIRRPEGIFPSLPSGMDRALKEYFDSYLEKNNLPPELEHLTGVSLFNDVEKLKIWRSNFKGISWTDKSGNILRGAIDNVLVKNNKLIILDYKTRGYPLKENTHQHYQDQLDFYNFLFRKNGYETEDYSYLLFYHPSNFDEKGKVNFNVDLVQIDVSVDNAEQIFNQAIQVLKNEMPSYSENCVYCKWLEKVTFQK